MPGDLSTIGLDEIGSARGVDGVALGAIAIF